MTQELWVSVIIPFYGNENYLTRCLEALLENAFVKDLNEGESNLEVIIVDNHKTPVLKESNFPEKILRLTHEPKPGSYAARNKGIQESRGKYLFFTDADCMPHEDWIKEGVQLLKNDKKIVAGPIELLFDKNDEPTRLELYERTFYFQQKKYVKKENYGATANLMVEKTVFDKVGLFDPTLHSGGDQEWGQRATAQSFNIIYSKGPKVYHSSRNNWMAFLKRRVRTISGDLLLYYKQHGLSWKQLREKLKFYWSLKTFRQWNADWNFFDSLPPRKQKAILFYHRLMTIFDMAVLVLCKLSDKRLKKFTLIDRH